MRRELSHIDARGDARMVDVGDKAVTDRVAVAEAVVAMKPATAKLLREGRSKKGDVLAAARIAGIMAAKRTPEWIPLCHAVPLTSVRVECAVRAKSVVITVTAKATGKTGVEMEALVGASAAALTVYDMLKAVDRAMTTTTRLREKHGGKSGSFILRAKP